MELGTEFESVRKIIDSGESWSLSFYPAGSYVYSDVIRNLCDLNTPGVYAFIYGYCAY